MKAAVTIEYCKTWNYKPRAASLAAKIREVSCVNSVKLIPSSGGAFEIRFHGELLHSKLETGEWPDFDAIAQRIKSKVDSK